MVKLFIVSGYADADGRPLNRFGPADPVTFAQAVKMSLRATGRPESGGIARNASANGTWAQGWIVAAQTLRLSVITPLTNVHAPASRGAMVQLLLESFGAPINQFSHPFTDLPPSHLYARALSTAYKLGLVTGDSNAPEGKKTIRPDSPINRAEAATLTLRFLQYFTGGR